MHDLMVKYYDLFTGHALIIELCWTVFT